MLKIKLFEWLGKTFGESRHGNLINFVEQISEKDAPQNSKKFLIHELRLTFQMKNQDEKLVEPVNIKLWREELEKLTDSSIRAFHCEVSDIYDSNIKENTKGRSFTLIVNIFHKQEI